MLTDFVLLGLWASLATAHGTVSGVVADGVYYTGYSLNFQYMNPIPTTAGWSIPKDQSLGPLTPDQFSSPDINCHVGATPGQTSVAIKAGGQLELQWTPWPESHKGPVMDYLANCNGPCETVDKMTLQWFKIDGVGLIDNSVQNGKWASDVMIANNNSWTVTIPADIAQGNYVIRHETIALHEAGNQNGAQAYPQCVNLAISGSGTAKPDGVVGTALYKATDPGILINIYTTLSTYPVPGPTPYSGAVSLSQTAPAAPTASATGVPPL
ncbi:glycoside hydrolase family 61 protein [Coleophoma crateriformis]|uniref:Glycoside hydrolase family 61 protein n=1 Tax=Coleophoma crateriformis TaxID=565419 RepID=A0A3D8Q417_9HELO|nr:glycoside hydrolase family 61 protein [Coleophoma crateriformis]